VIQFMGQFVVSVQAVTSGIELSHRLELITTLLDPE